MVELIKIVAVVVSILCVVAVIVASIVGIKMAIKYSKNAKGPFTGRY